MNREFSRFIGDLFDFVADRWMLFAIVGAIGFLFGPSLLVWLDRKQRLPRPLVWVYSVTIVPVLLLFMLVLANPQNYCNDPLPHDDFRIFYPLIIPLVPLYVHCIRSEHVGHPYLFGFILLALSLGVFALTVGYEVFHLAYQSAQGHGVVYSGARAWECAYVNPSSQTSARSVVRTATLLFMIGQTLVLAAARFKKRTPMLGSSSPDAQS